MTKENESNPQSEKLKALQAAMSKIEKDFGKGSIMRMDNQLVNLFTLSTRQLKTGARYFLTLSGLQWPA